MTVTIVQSQTAYIAASAAATVTLSSVTAGNTIVTMIFVDKDGGTLTQPTGYTMIQWSNLVSVSGGMSYKVAAGGETTVTWTRATGTRPCSVFAMEISGLTATPYDVSAMTATGDTSVTSRSTGTTGTTAQADEYAIAAVMVDTMSNATTGRAWTNSFTEYALVNNTGGTGLEGGSVATKTLAATGTVESTFSTTGAGDQMMAMVATFKIASTLVMPNNNLYIEKQSMNRSNF